MPEILFKLVFIIFIILMVETYKYFVLYHSAIKRPVKFVKSHHIFLMFHSIFQVFPHRTEPLGSFILSSSYGWMIPSIHPLPNRKTETTKPKISNIIMNKRRPQCFFGFSVIFLNAILDLLKECHLKHWRNLCLKSLFTKH